LGLSSQLLFGTHAPFYYIASAVLKVVMSDINEAEKGRILNTSLKVS